jgi:hypothetical protein
MPDIGVPRNGLAPRRIADLGSRRVVTMPYVHRLEGMHLMIALDIQRRAA